jgi:hypothetical protein
MKCEGRMFVRDLGLKYVRDPCPATAPPRPLHPARSTHSVPLQPLDLCSTPTPHSRVALRFSTPAHGCRLSFSLPWCRPGSHRTRCTHRSLCFPLRHAGLFPRDRLFFSAAVVGVPDAPRACYSRSDLCCLVPSLFLPLLPVPSCPVLPLRLLPAPLVLWMASENKGDCATPLAPPVPLASVSPRTCAPPRSRGSGRVRLRCPRRVCCPDRTGGDPGVPSSISIVSPITFFKLVFHN